MKNFVFTVVSIMLITSACRQSESPTVSSAIDCTIQQKKVVTDTKGADSLAYMDTTKMVVDSVVNIKVNNTLLPKKANNVYLALYTNWLRAYTESSHLPVALRISYLGTVMMGARGDIMDEVVKAQDNMKQYIARDKFKKRYDSLSPGQQASIQHEHVILFQKDFR